MMNKDYTSSSISKESNNDFYKIILPILKKHKVSESNIKVIMNSIESIYDSGWSNGYHDCEADMEESI